MLEKILNIYIYILNYLYEQTKKINNRVREVVIIFSCLYFSYWRYINASRNDAFFIKIKYSAIILCLVLVAFLLVSNDRKIVNVTYNKHIVLLFSLILLGSYLRYIFHFPTWESYYYFLQVIVFTFIFPLIYIVWNNRKDYDYLFEKLALAYAIFGFAYYINLFRLSFNAGLVIDDNGYLLGSLINSNFIGELSVCCSVSSLYLLYRYNAYLYKKIFVNITFCVGIVLSFMSCCRTSLLAIAFSSIGFLLYIKNRFQKKELIINMLILSISFVFIVISSKIMIAIQYKDINKIVSYNPFIYPLNKYNRTIADGDINRISSGRIDIWKKYIKYFNLFGRERSELAREFNYGYVYEPHNAIFDITYRYGIPTGIIYTLFLIYTGIFCLCGLFNNKNNAKINVLTIVVVFMYGIYVVVDSSTCIYYSQPALLYYLSIMPIFREDIVFSKKKNNKQ